MKGGRRGLVFHSFRSQWRWVSYLGTPPHDLDSRTILTTFALTIWQPSTGVWICPRGLQYQPICLLAFSLAPTLGAPSAFLRALSTCPPESDPSPMARPPHELWNGGSSAWHAIYNNILLLVQTASLVQICPQQSTQSLSLSLSLVSSTSTLWYYLPVFRVSDSRILSH